MDTCRTRDDRFAQVRKLFSPREVLELLLLVWYFRMIYGVMTTLDVDVGRPFGAKILDSVRDAVSCA